MISGTFRSPSRNASSCFSELPRSRAGGFDNGKRASLALTAEDLERFVKTFSRDDTFTLLYLLTKVEAPRTLEDLCRRYGASPSEMKDRLDRLNGLGLISQRGRGYLASAKAVVAMQSLEERLGKGRLPAAAI